MEMNLPHPPCSEKSEDTLYRIGMFAAMNRVSVKALRFYEEIGLLLPAVINKENGYRYYKLQQMAELHRITALKQAGFTLEEIAAMKQGAGEEDIILKKKAEIMAQIAELTSQAAALDGLLAQKGQFLTTPVLIKTLPEVKIAYMEKKLTSYDALFDLMPAMGSLMEEAGCCCALPEYCFTNYLEPAAGDREMSVEICEAVMEEKKGRDGLKFKTLPSVKAACAFHRGSYSSLKETYGAVLRFIEEKGWQVAGPIRESYIDGIWNKDREADWLTEVQVPVAEGPDK